MHPQCGSVPYTQFSRKSYLQIYPEAADFSLLQCPCPVLPPLLIPISWQHPASCLPHRLLFPHAAEGVCELLSQAHPSSAQYSPVAPSHSGKKTTSPPRSTKPPQSAPITTLSSLPTTLLFAPWAPAHRLSSYSLLLPQGLCTCYYFPSRSAPSLDIDLI